MEIVKLSPENVNQYLGCDVTFFSRGVMVKKKILAISPSGKSVKIDHPDLKNSLEIVNRKVYVFLKK